MHRISKLVNKNGFVLDAEEFIYHLDQNKLIINPSASYYIRCKTPCNTCVFGIYIKECALTTFVESEKEFSDTMREVFP